MTLAVRGLSHSFGARRLFDGLEFALEDGRSLALRGSSGAGKTTLLRLLCGLDPLQSGTVQLDGRDLAEWGACAWRVEVGYVAQGAPGLSGRPLELLAQVEQLRHQGGRAAERPQELAARWGLDEASWDRPWLELSQGERQRAQLAIVLSRRPRVLLLDEPTSALDPDARDAVEASLRGRTALWVTHDPAQAARVADEVLELAP